eukprot:1428420-Pleurochrysis_carterae.AAC.1
MQPSMLAAAVALTAGVSAASPTASAASFSACVGVPATLILSALRSASASLTQPSRVGLLPPDCADGRHASEAPVPPLSSDGRLA